MLMFFVESYPLMLMVVSCASRALAAALRSFSVIGCRERVEERGERGEEVEREQLPKTIPNYFRGNDSFNLALAVDIS
jgi:hypothetical protein